MLADNPHKYAEGPDGLRTVPDINLKYEIDEPTNQVRFKEI